MEINIGEYVRTKKGHIYRIKSQLTIDMLMFIKEIEPIVKHSKNIIDLIEAGDYVNGERVDSINGILYAIRIGPIEDIEIKTILTHELHEENCYKVVE